MTEEREDASWKDIRVAMREREQARKAVNMEENMRLIEASGYEYVVLNFGTHLRMDLGETVVDLWPSTDRYWVRGDRKSKIGISKLFHAVSKN